MSLLTYLLHLLLLLLIVAAGVGVWCYHRPMPGAEPVMLAAREPLAAFDKRHMEHVTLHSEKLGDIGLALSLPDPLPPEKLPILMVLGGLGTGEDNIHNIRDAGNNAIIGYDWPMPTRIPGGFGLLLRMPGFYSQVMTVPGQIASGAAWIAAQDWADNKRICILGFSLGALATPAAQDAIQDNQLIVHSTIIAYGGAPLGDVFATDTHIHPDIMRRALAPVIDILLHPIEPDLHALNLEGSFLVLEGKNDGLMPEDARARLRDAVPQPKTIVDFEGDHMGTGPDKAALLQKIIDTSRAWLLKEDAVNPL